MTCGKVAKNNTNLKKLAQKNQIGKSGGERKKNPSANPDLSDSIYLNFFSSITISPIEAKFHVGPP